MKKEVARTAAGVWLLLLAILVTGCASSLYGWQVRTNSTPIPPSFSPASLEQYPVALFPAVTLAALRGNEVGLANYLGQIVSKVRSRWKVVSEAETVTRINRQGLAAEYTRMRADYDQSNILDRDSLRRIASAIGVRYVFQLRLAALTQTMTDRWKIPAFDVRMSQTRSSIVRLSLQLWDAETGELVWASLAETNMANEAVSQDPVYLEDIARVTLGSMMADFVNQKSASTYTSVNKFLNNLVEESVPHEKPEQQKITEPDKKAE